MDDGEPSSQSTESEPADDEDAGEQEVSVEMKGVFFFFFGRVGRRWGLGEKAMGKSLLSLCVHEGHGE